MKGGRDEAASQLEDVRAQWKRRHTEAAPPATSWSCAVCTLDNAAATALCDACGATRDPPPASPPTARWALHTSGAYLHSSHEPPAPASSLAVMDLNVWFEPCWFEQRVLEQLAWMRRLQADVVCLQEVTPPYLAHLLRDAWVQSRYALHTMDVGRYGTLILTRHVPLRASRFPLPTEMGRDLALVQFDVGALAVDAQPADRRPHVVTVCTVHLESMSEYAARRVEQLRRIFPLIDAACADYGGGSPALLCGDFNYNANMSTCEEERAIPAAQWRDVSTDRANTLGHNFPSKKYPPGRFDRMLLHQPVDCSTRLECAQWRTFGDERLPVCATSAPVNDYLKRFGPKISDHVGLFTRFLLHRK